MKSVLVEAKSVFRTCHDASTDFGSSRGPSPLKRGLQSSARARTSLCVCVCVDIFMSLCVCFMPEEGFRQGAGLCM